MEMSNIVSGLLPSELILKAWDCKNFKNKLESNPREVLFKEGFKIESDKKVAVNTKNSRYFNLILPEKPDSIEKLSEKALKKLIVSACNNTGTCS